MQKHHTKGFGPTGTLSPYCDGGTGDAWGILFGKPEPVLQGISLCLAPLDGWFLNLVCKSNTAGLSRFMVACVFGAICLEPGQLEVDHLEETQTYIPLKYISLFTKVFEPQIYLNIVS